MGQVEYSEIKLLKDVNERLPGSYKPLHARLFPLLYVLSKRITGDSAEAEDIVSGAFVKLYTSLSALQFESLAHVQNYLAKLVRHESINFTRRPAGMKTLPLEDNNFADSDQGAGFDLLELKFQEAIWNLRRERVTRAMSLLNIRSVAVVRMYYLEGKSTREIAEALKVAPQTVLNLKTNGLRIISSVVKKEALLVGPGLLLLLIVLHQSR